MNGIFVNQGQTITSTGNGAPWLDMCMTLDALGLSVSGAWVADVGIRGLTIEGMLEFLVEDNRSLVISFCGYFLTCT